MIQVFRQEADMIRNNVLQDIFVIRRCVEVSGQTRFDAEGVDFDGHLAQLEKVYTQLENFCNRIEAPHIEDSLPLALFHAVKPWQKRICMSLELPHDWGAEPVERTWLMTLIARSLTQEISKDIFLPEQCVMTLQYQEEIPSLIFCARYKDLVPSSLASETDRVLLPLLETFQVLAQGQYNQYSESRSHTWVLRWTNQPQVNSTPI